jgi:predicted metalloprotease
MQWRGRRGSVNVEDRRSARGVGVAGGGIGTLLVVGLMFWLSGGDPQVLIDSGILESQPTSQTGPPSPAEEEAVEFVKVVLADTEDVWNQLFQQQGSTYAEPKLVLFRGRVDSACGLASSAVGPFYCPLDQDVYLDLEFFSDLKERFGAPGDFAAAYVIAHEVGHHVQKLVGLADKVHAQQQQAGETEANRLSVRLELQADYLAGVWAHYEDKTKNVLDRNDIDEALRAATAIGDDRLQKQSGGSVVPDSFTHGTSAQRLRWFKQGYTSGSFEGAKALFDGAYEQL